MKTKITSGQEVFQGADQKLCRLDMEELTSGNGQDMEISMYITRQHKQTRWTNRTVSPQTSFDWCAREAVDSSELDTTSLSIA